MAKAKRKNKVKVQKQPVEVPDISADIEKVINSSVKTTANSSAVPSVLMKVCRLCGGKEGPFLNIFDQDQMTAIKIDQLMPFRIEENDDLPHKICFRCSAKLEELHEFVSKSVKTQENLHTTVGKNPPVITKTNTRQMWEEKLNKSNLSNEDICNALIKKAMEGIKDIPLTPEEEEPIVIPKKETKNTYKPGPLSKKEVKKIEEDNNVQLKEIKLSLDKCDELPKRSLRNKNVEKPPDSPVEKKKIKPTKETPKPVIQESSSSEDDEVEVKEVPKENAKITSLSFDFDEGSFDNKNNKIEEITQKKTESEPPEKPFNIMDHICMIKVNGVGVLFQCKLCNRNFLKKEVVQTHSCAKNGIPKVDLTKNILPPEPPRITTVKYINTKVDDVQKVVLKEEPVKPPEVKRKPRIGPASRVKHNNSDTVTQDLNTSQEIIPNPQQIQQQSAPNPPPAAAIVNFPTMPGLNGRFRLIPGPNNTFTLCEDTSTPITTSSLTNNTFMTNNVSSPINNNPSQIVTPVSTNKDEPKKSRKRKPNNPPAEENISLPKNQLVQSDNSKPLGVRGRSFIDLVDNDDSPKFTVTSRNPTPIAPTPVNNTVHDQPYPVGLFQTVSRAPEPPAFTTPAMKKQSYTIVQTGNPSKLLISTKPQLPVEEAPKKKKKLKQTKTPEGESQQPFNVTLEDASHDKGRGFFTFINVDPLLQPSYVLPTDNIIQESQISTSTTMVQPASVSKEKDKYPCNMCNESFSREKKLLAHIQSHYSKMDEEDLQRAERSESRRRSRRS